MLTLLAHLVISAESYVQEQNILDVTTQNIVLFESKLTSRVKLTMNRNQLERLLKYIHEHSLI